MKSKQKYFVSALVGLLILFLVVVIGIYLTSERSFRSAILLPESDICSVEIKSYSTGHTMLVEGEEKETLLELLAQVTYAGSCLFSPGPVQAQDHIYSLIVWTENYYSVFAITEGKSHMITPCNVYIKNVCPVYYYILKIAE